MSRGRRFIPYSMLIRARCQTRENVDQNLDSGLCRIVILP